jgi:hypothetical protein
VERINYRLNARMLIRTDYGGAHIKTIDGTRCSFKLPLTLGLNLPTEMLINNRHLSALTIKIAQVDQNKLEVKLPASSHWISNTASKH